VRSRPPCSVDSPGPAVVLRFVTGMALTAVPWVVDQAGWRWAVLLLAVGPVAGAVAMARLDVLLRRPGGVSPASASAA
jgi:hypothetical protein